MKIYVKLFKATFRNAPPSFEAYFLYISREWGILYILECMWLIKILHFEEIQFGEMEHFLIRHILSKILSKCNLAKCTTPSLSYCIFRVETPG